MFRPQFLCCPLSLKEVVTPLLLIKYFQIFRGQKVLELVRCHHLRLTMIFLEQYQRIKEFQEALHLHMRTQ